MQPTVTAVGRIHSAIVISRQLQGDAQERIVRFPGLLDLVSQASLTEAIEDLARAQQGEIDLRGQLEQALQLEASLRAFLQGAEEV